MCLRAFVCATCVCVRVRVCVCTCVCICVCAYALVRKGGLMHEQARPVTCALGSVRCTRLPASRRAQGLIARPAGTGRPMKGVLYRSYPVQCAARALSQQQKPELERQGCVHFFGNRSLNRRGKAVWKEARPSGGSGVRSWPCPRYPCPHSCATNKPARRACAPCACSQTQAPCGRGPGMHVSLQYGIRRVALGRAFMLLYALQACACTQAHTHTCLHAHMHAYTRTRAHTSTQTSLHVRAPVISLPSQRRPRVHVK